jgi:hypothetical protein
MKTISYFTIVGVAITCLLLAACSGAPIKTGATNQRIDTAEIDFSKGRRISASASGFQLLLLIPISINSRHERAYRMLLAQAGSDYVADIKIDESWTYALVGTVYKTTIEAMAYPQKTD